MASFYGSDTSCVTGLSLIDQQITNPSVLIGQRLARRLQTPRGALALIGDDPNFGLDVRQYVNGKVGPNEEAAIQSAVQSECLKDEQVQAVTVIAKLSAGTLTLAITGVAGTGPFKLTLNVTSLTVDAVFNP